MLKFWLFLALIALSTQQEEVDLEQLLSSMTIEEKCGQMTQVTFDVIANNIQVKYTFYVFFIFITKKENKQIFIYRLLQMIIQ